MNAFKSSDEFLLRALVKANGPVEAMRLRGLMAAEAPIFNDLVMFARALKSCRDAGFVQNVWSERERGYAVALTESGLELAVYGTKG